VTQLTAAPEGPAPVPEGPAPEQPAGPRKTRRGRLFGLPPWVRDLIEVVLIALILYVIIWNALQTVRVDGTSMVGTLQDQDLLLASKVSYDFGMNPSRGDIVILVPPGQPTKDFIKRVIGLPGDVIEIDGSKQPTEVLIKPGGQGPFQVLNEPYLPQPWTSQDFCCKTQSNLGQAQSLLTTTPEPMTIPQGYYFVMGDNRNYSSDSRAFGLVPRNQILAKAFLRIWPLGHFGGLGSGPSLQTAATAGSVILPMGGVGLLEVGRWRRRRARRARRVAAAADGDGEPLPGRRAPDA
jgi:signal peptidase I